MLRGHRMMVPAASSLLPRRPSPAATALAFGAQRRQFTDKLVVSSASAFMTCTTTMALFHLFVVPISGSIFAATVATATASGALCVIDGGRDAAGTSFGAVIGLFIGAMGCAYAKSQKEPWRK